MALRHSLNSGIGGASKLPWIQGKYFFVSLPALASHTFVNDLWNVVDKDGINRLHVRIDSAINACVANRGDVIVISDKYYETITSDNLITLDVAGVTLMGLGYGQDRPEIRFAGDITGTLPVSAANVKLKNLILTCNIDNQAKMITVTSTGFNMKRCEVREGSGVPRIMLDITGAGVNETDDAIIKKSYFYAPTASNGDAAIELGEVADSIKIIGNEIYGNFDDAGIHNPTGKVLTNLLLEKNKVSNTQSGQHAIELVSACTGMAVDNRLYSDSRATMFDPGSLICVGNIGSDTIDEAGVPIPDTADTADNYIGKNTADNEVSTSNVVSNSDGSVLERLEDLKQTVGDAQGLSYQGTCDAGMVASQTTVVCAELAGYGNDFFNNKYYLSVILNANSAGNFPENKVLVITDYVSSTGTFTVGAGATANIEAGDEILVLHESIVSIGRNDTDNAFSSTSVVDNEDGSVLERLTRIQNSVSKGAGTPIATNKSIADALGTDGATVTDGTLSVLGAIGVNSNNNLFDSSLVVASRDGSLMERTEQIQSDIDAIGLAVGTGTGGVADAGSGVATLVDAALVQANDYWNGARLVMTSGLNNGLARYISDFDDATNTATVYPAFPAAIVAGDTYEIIPDDGISRLGDNQEAATDPSAATGTLFSKIRGVGDNADSISGDVGDASASTLASLYGILGNPAVSVSASIGANAEAATDPSAATGTIFSKMRGVGDNADSILGDVGDASASTLASLYGILGNPAVSVSASIGANDEAATDPSAASGTIFSKIRGIGDNADSILGDVGDASASTLASLYGILGNPAVSVSASIGANAEAATDPSAASGTIFSKLRGIGDDTAVIGTLVNSGGTATLAAILGDVANYPIANELANIETKIGDVKDVAEKTIIRNAAVLPASIQAPIFTFNQPIRLIEIIGRVYGGNLETAACNLKMTYNPTYGADTDLCANLDVNATAEGSILSITAGNLVATMKRTANGLFYTIDQGLTLSLGSIDLVTDATITGNVVWYMRYIPLVVGGTVAAA